MKKAKLENEEMRAEYRREDLGPLVRGKYANAVRRALQAYAKQRADLVVTSSPSALDLAGDLVGCFSGTVADLSSNPAHLADFGRV